MLRKTLFLLLFFIAKINGIDESLETYSKLNGFQTINKNQAFIIETTEESIAYFDSYDKVSTVYISTDYEKYNSKKDERITGKFYKIKPNTKYYVRNNLYFSDYPSVFKKYLNPLDLSKEEINIDDNSYSYLYLLKDKEFILNFEKCSIKKMITLSRKTLNAKITIKKSDKTIELNKNNIYYKIEEGFKGTIKLEIKENDAFIEFLSGMNAYDNYEILDSEYLFQYELESKTSIIIFKYTQRDLNVELSSDMPFKFSFSYGFSNDKNYYYSSISNIDIQSSKASLDEYNNSIKLHNIFRYFTSINNDFFSFTVKVERSVNQKIYISYREESTIDHLLGQNIDEQSCKDIIKNIQDLMEIYVYSDIAKNPPKINELSYHHEKIDLKKEFGKISTYNRNFYEFYQDIEKILGTVKDLHLNIRSTIIKDYAFLPFKFVIKEINNVYKIFIEKNSFYNQVTQDIKNFIDKHLDIPIKSINDIDPMDYIQNWSKFRKTKNDHAQFTYIMRIINSFNLADFPFNYSDLSLNDYEFDDNKLLRIPYFFGGTTKFLKNNLEFDNYFLNVIENYDPIGAIPLIDEIYENFLIFKGEKKIFKSETKNKIIWDNKLSYIEGVTQNKFIKCRVDKDNKVNVIYQNTFGFEDLYEAIGKIVKCVSEFYTNNYPIIIIESKNGGGYVLIYQVLHQILQTKIEDIFSLSYKITSISEQYYGTKTFNGIDNEKCNVINTFTDFNNFYIDSYGDNSISHKRIPPFDLASYKLRTVLKGFREQYENSPNLKRPTDIIIFTDSYSYSATSLFIKSFQNTGGAITVGFFGNPKIEGTDLFDASQSPTTVESNENLGITTMQKELDNYNFAARISSGETYNFHQPNIKDQIPREYALDPVDFRVNIYSDYSDDLYDKFIKEGKKIHDEVNNQNKCNSKNEKLLLDDDINCYYIPGYDHAHGGYKCGDDNIWDKSKCLPYYCDIGYYFDQYQKKCIENCNLEKTKGYIIYEDNYKKEFLIKKDTTYYFFIAKNIKKHQFIYYYTYQGNNKYNVPKNNYITINPNKNLVQDIYLTIEEKPSINVNMLPLYGQTTSYSFIDDSESLLFIEMSEDFNLYLDNAFKSSKTEFKLAEYNNEMTLENILNHDSKYFLDYKESIRSFQKNQLYLLYVKFHELDPFNIFINPKITEEIIDINNNEIDFLYLENNKVYTLDFKNNLINRLIKLSRETLNAEIFIENKNIKLNSDNLYYLIEDNYKGVLKLHVSKDNALIEFLFKQSNDEIEILDFEKRKFILKNKYNILGF